MKQGKFTPTELSRVATNLLQFLDDKSISSYAELDSHVGKTYPLSDKGEQIEIKIRGSGRIEKARPDSLACVLSYTTSGFGIPLEFRMNKDKRASLIIAKASFYLDGYKPFATDRFGNFIQLKVLHSLDMGEVKATLKDLVLKRD